MQVEVDWGGPRHRNRLAALCAALGVAVFGLGPIGAGVRAPGGDLPAAIAPEESGGSGEPSAPRPVEDDRDRPRAEPSTTVPPSEPITIALAGDIHASGGLGARLAADPSGFVGPFAPLLSGVDLAIGNLETAVAPAGVGRPAAKQFTFHAPPVVVDALRSGGFDVLSMANNHGLDLGPEALAASLEVKRSSGAVVGIGADEAEAYAPAIVDVGAQRVAVIGATQVLDGHLIESWTAGPGRPGLASAKRVDRLVAEVRAAREVAGLVVVFLHWGVEKQTCPSASQRELAAQLAAAGADVLVGGHAHRLQGAGRLGGTFVAYGLGNFLFAARPGPGEHTGVLTLTVRGRHVESYRWHPGRIRDGVPVPLTGAEAAAATAAWDGLRGCTGLSA